MKICYWDPEAQQQRERDSTPEEDAQRELDLAVSAVLTVADYTSAIQAMLDAAARARNYDDIVSACSYAGAPNPFQAEGAAFVAWRGACWATCYQIMGEVESGNRPQPSLAELLAAMPAF
jgi:hypothetical protein